MKAIQELNLYNYIECSAKTSENLVGIFSESIRAAFKYRELLMNKRKKKKRACNIL